MIPLNLLKLNNNQTTIAIIWPIVNIHNIITHHKANPQVFQYWTRFYLTEQRTHPNWTYFPFGGTQKMSVCAAEFLLAVSTELSLICDVITQKRFPRNWTFVCTIFSNKHLAQSVSKIPFLYLMVSLNKPMKKINTLRAPVTLMCRINHWRFELFWRKLGRLCILYPYSTLNYYT